MDLTFKAFRAANDERQKNFKNRKGEPSPSSEWDLSDWVTATSGELGEAAEAYIFFMIVKSFGKAADIVKKINRADYTLEEARDALGRELANVQAYLDLFALKAGIDLDEATITKWNEVSERIGYPVRLGAKQYPPRLELGRDGSERRAHYGDGEQPWDTIVRLGWGPAFAAGNILKYLRRDKDREHSLQSACWYYAQMVEHSAHTHFDWTVTLRELNAEITHDERGALGLEE